MGQLKNKAWLNEGNTLKLGIMSSHSNGKKKKEGIDIY